MKMARSERAKATVTFNFSSAREAEAVRQALGPEEALPSSSRCNAGIRRRENALILEVDAEDTAALRAALNSFVRWAIVARDMLQPRGK